MSVLYKFKFSPSFIPSIWRSMLLFYWLFVGQKIFKEGLLFRLNRLEAKSYALNLLESINSTFEFDKTIHIFNPD